MIAKILDYLNIRKAGGIELFFASLMILSAYSFKGISLQVVLWGVLLLWLFIKNRRNPSIQIVPLTLLCIFVLIHDFLYLFIADGNLNAYIMQIVYFSCIFLAVRVFDIEKLKGSLNLIALISMVGLLFQWVIIAAGGEIRPIQLPFLDMSQNRLESFSVRPSSFFMEPAAYVAFMYIPLAFSLIDKKFIWTAAIIFSEFLTTSTTGLLTSFIVLIVYVFTQKVSFKIRMFTVVMGVAMFFAVTNLDAFQTGIEKLENTDVENNIRLVQGPYIVSTMTPVEMIAGAPYHNAYDYCRDGRAPYVVYYNEEVYMSTFWMIILKYGFIGLVLYLLFYINVAFKRRDTIPIVVCMFATMFSSGYGVGSNFVYLSIGLLLMLYNNQTTNKSVSQ